MKEQLAQGLAALGLPTGGIPHLERYAQMLVETNKVMNLTAITEPDQIAALHFLDSAALLHFCELKGKQVADIGTGAGFPGLPLKILEPSLSLTLLDSLRKRVDFLQSVVEELGLEEVQCIHGRAEEFAREHREQYDFVTSRAVASLPMLTELTLPLVKVGGYFVAMKSTDSEGELKQSLQAIRLLGGQVERQEDYEIPGTEVTHRLIFVKKISETNKKYPRAFTQIKKRPL